jgi:ABC-type uncharacterized transport system fused permease/ATPase subunit
MEVQASPLQAVLVSSQVMGSGGAPTSDLKRVAARWLGVARLWWRCPAERRRAWAYTAACVALSLTNVGLLLWISYVQNALQTALSEKQQGEWRGSSSGGGGGGRCGNSGGRCGNSGGSACRGFLLPAL